MSTLKVVMIPEARDSRFKAWRKHLTGVDVTKKDGYAFLGEFLSLGRLTELQVGAYILQYDEVGSWANREPEVGIRQVMVGGNLSKPLIEAEGRSWALRLRDKAAALFAESTTKAALIIRREELFAELARIEDVLTELERTE